MKTNEIQESKGLATPEVMLSDLPDEFYDKFTMRQIKDCGGQMFNNIDAQYHYAI